MNQNQDVCRALAGRIYDLDAEVYRVLGSSLGRVFNHQREACIEEITQQMLSRSESYILRDELALISNMARTISDQTERDRVLREYNDILTQVEAMSTSFVAVDILDKNLAELNSDLLAGRFAENQHLIICIGRTYGCAGSDIGFTLADKLRINYYDSEIFEVVLDRLKAEQGSVHDRASFARHQELNPRSGKAKGRTLKERFQEFNRYHGLPAEDAIFFNQSDLLREMAQKEDFVVMGRCADVILSNCHIPHISIFINAPFEQRVCRVMELEGLDRKAARKFLNRMDRRHRHYYEFFTGREWGSSANYDLCINSASHGINGSVELIERIINQHTGRN